MQTATTRMEDRFRSRELLIRSNNDNYDVLLYREWVGEKALYSVDVLMKVQFVFEDGSGGRWSGGERTRYMRDWERVIRAVWSTSTLLPRTAQREVHFRPVFDSTTSKVSDEHWTVLVVKLNAADRAVERGIAIQGRKATSDSPLATNIVRLNQHQNRLVSFGETVQSTSAHEYGHMLNYWHDDYKDSSPHRQDTASIMHSGSSVRARHLARFRTWATRAIERIEEREREEARRRVSELNDFRDRVIRGRPAARDAYRHIDDRQRRRANL